MEKNKTNIISIIMSSKVKDYYNYIMIGIILFSLVPLVFKEKTIYLELIDKVTVSVFILDYFLRWILAILKKKKVSAVFSYPLTPFAIIDLLSILPSINIISSSFKLFRIFRLFRAFRVFRAFKILRYSKNLIIIINVLKKEKQALITVGSMAICYILISAMAIFNIEPSTFDTFFDAVYWATISLTTVGYGDIYPVSDFGRLITMISSFIGIAIVALPAGIITAGYLSEIKKED